MKHVFVLRFLGLVAAGCVARESYHLINETPVGGEGEWDYLTDDSMPHRPCVSHATKMVVIGLNAGSIVDEITPTSGVHGVAAALDLDRSLATCGRENKAALLDLKTLRVLSKVETGANPDGALYES